MKVEAAKNDKSEDQMKKNKQKKTNLNISTSLIFKYATVEI